MIAFLIENTQSFFPRQFRPSEARTGTFPKIEGPVRHSSKPAELRLGRRTGDPAAAKQSGAPPASGSRLRWPPRSTLLESAKKATDDRQEISIVDNSGPLLFALLNNGLEVITCAYACFQRANGPVLVARDREFGKGAHPTRHGYCRVATSDKTPRSSP
jgi:hypothetical protein